MTVDPQDVTTFKAILARTPVEVIIKRLDDNVILRSWKRQLAEAEVERRGYNLATANAQSKSSSTRRHKLANLKAWFITALLIAAALALAAVLSMDLVGH